MNKERCQNRCLRSSEGRTRFSLIGVYFPCNIVIVDGGKSFINSIGVIGISLSVVDDVDEEVADDEETAGAACAFGVDDLVDVEVDDVDVSVVVEDDEVDSADVDEVETAAVAFIFVNKSRNSCFSIHADI